MKVLRILVVTVLVLGVAFLIYWAFNPETSPAWTGFGEYKEKEGMARSKTLWDWLELIIVPTAIGLFVWIYTEFEKTKNEKIEKENAQSSILESFFKTMTELLLNHDLAGETEKKRLAIARTRINIALDQLDGSRKGQVLQFLYESDLIEKVPIIIQYFSIQKN